MPIYEYSCQKCREHHEILQKITEEPLTICPSCGGSLKKMISNTSFVLKGTGWYATDYASNRNKCKSEPAGTKKAAETTADAAGKKESDQKAETKKETAAA